MTRLACTTLTPLNQLHFILLGVGPLLTDITSCIGDNVTYTCTVNSRGHTWIISSLPQTVVIVRSKLRISMPPYSFMLVEDVGTTINSTLSLTVFAGFNGTAIAFQLLSEFSGGFFMAKL